MTETKGVEKMSKEIQVADPVQVEQVVQSATPMDLIARAQANGADIETISKYMDLQERYENREALREYNKAVALFKTENTVIYKNANVDFKTKTGIRVNYKHATLGSIVNTVTPLLAKYGLNHSWAVRQEGQSITVKCKLSHSDGHSESVSLFGPPDSSGLKSPVQAVASTVTFLQRYTLSMILGLASGDPDNDGRGAPKSAPVKTITESQCADLEALIDEVKADKMGFLSYLKIASLEQLPASNYKSAIKALEGKRGDK